MRIQAKTKIEISESADKVWSVIAHEFENIAKWCTGVKQSCAITDGKVTNVAKVSGRVCDNIGEKFTHYDEQSKSFVYRGTNLPWFIRGMGNRWSVIPLESNKSEVVMVPELDVNIILGLFLVPIIPFFKMYGNRVIADLKYYVENGEPHPRKIKEIERLRP